MLVLPLGVTLWATSIASTWMSLAISITLTRGIGQSMLSVASLAIIGKSFPRRPGTIMGAYAVLMTMLMAVATGWLGAQVTAVGWRDAWRQLGLQDMTSRTASVTWFDCENARIALTCFEQTTGENSRERARMS